jgi:coenzyme F420-reducing hydrogenase beta subunit
LEEGKKVLFSGTPCQIAGLYSYLKKDYPDLFTQDFICHGVPSPKVWQKYLQYRETNANSHIQHVEFRNKDKGWKTYSLKISFDDGSLYSKTVLEDMYLKLFTRNMSLRESCENCSFKNIHRQADITLADFWGLKNVLADWDDNQGTSLVMTHSEKGKRLLESVSKCTRIEEVDFKNGIRSNPSMVMSSSLSLLRKNFFRDLNKLPFDKLYIKYCGNSFKVRYKREIIKIINRIKNHIWGKI